MTLAVTHSSENPLAEQLATVGKAGQVVILVEPYHSLGQSVCRQLAREQLRPVVVSSDPARGEAFSIRMAIEGFSVPHRTLHGDFPRCEELLADDLRKVYGGLRGVVSFFQPIRRQSRWLELPIIVADAMLQRSVSQRLRLLKALAPMLTDQGFLLDVVMGVANVDGDPIVAVEGMTARLWDALLAGELERRGILVRRTYTRYTVRPGETGFRRDAERVLSEFHRCLQHTQPEGED